MVSFFVCFKFVKGAEISADHTLFLLCGHQIYNPERSSGERIISKDLPFKMSLVLQGSKKALPWKL